MTDQAEATEEITEDVIESDQTTDTELEPEGNEETPAPELWQVEDDTDDPDYTVDGKLHQAMKTKLKGRVSARDDEIEKLKAEVEALRLSGQKKEEPKVLSRPKRDDFVTDEEYDLELSKYDSHLAQETYNRNQAKQNQTAAQEQAKKQLTEAVDSHYVRAEALIKESGIKPENYQKADISLRKAIETIRPKEGDLIVDQMISKVGKGSEKVAYFLGVNKPARAKAMSLLSEDPTGMSLLVYLGQQKQRLTKPNKPQSGAPNPAPGIKGDEVTGNEEAKLKKRYQNIGPGTTASYKIKSEAKKAGYDVSTW